MSWRNPKTNSNKIAGRAALVRAWSPSLLHCHAGAKEGTKEKNGYDHRGAASSNGGPRPNKKEKVCGAASIECMSSIPLDHNRSDSRYSPRAPAHCLLRGPLGPLYATSHMQPQRINNYIYSCLVSCALSLYLVHLSATPPPLSPVRAPCFNGGRDLKVTGVIQLTIRAIIRHQWEGLKATPPVLLGALSMPMLLDA